MSGVGLAESGWEIQGTSGEGKKRTCYPQILPHLQYFISGPLIEVVVKHLGPRQHVFWHTEPVRNILKYKFIKYTGKSRMQQRHTDPSGYFFGDPSNWPPFPSNFFFLPFFLFRVRETQCCLGRKKFLFGDPLQDLNGEIVNGSNTCCCPKMEFKI